VSATQKKAQYTLGHLAEVSLHVVLRCRVASGAGGGRTGIKGTDRQTARAGLREEVPESGEGHSAG